MRNFMRLFFLLTLLYVNVWAAGETGLAILKIGVGSRAAAMGEAYTALSNDASGLFWNPAGIIEVDQRTAHITYNKWIQGVNNNAASVVFPNSYGTIGVGLVLNNVSGFERREIASEEPTGEFSAHDFIFITSFARKLSEQLSLGLNLKYLNEKIYIEDATGFAVDFGATYQVVKNVLTLGAAVQNIGKTNELKSEQIELPLTIRLGAVYKLPINLGDSEWRAAMDYVNIKDENSIINTGLEVWTLSRLFLRAGYQTGIEDRGLTAGFGLSLGAFELNYAYVPFERDLGNSQRFSLNAAF